MNPIAWPFATDWSNGITERLSWLTAIQTSRSGAEQRQALRVAPRRQIDLPVLITGQERAYFDILLMRNGGIAWYVPLPPEQVAVGEVQSAQTVFPMDTAYREIAVGTKLILRGTDAFHVELLEVNSVAADHVTTTPAASYYASATLTPAFLAVIAEKVDVSSRTAQVSTATVRFVSTAGMTWPVQGRALATVPTFAAPRVGAPAYPILTKPPNRLSDLDFSFERIWSTIDNSQSNPLYIDKSQRAFTSQKYEWFLYGPQERRDFRDLLFRLQGRAKPLWVPTFNDDLGYAQGYPNPLGFSDVAPPPGREYFAQFLADGSVNGYGVTAMQTGWRIPTEQFSFGNVLRNSFMALKRLDVDDIEIVHQVDRDGVATVSAVFRDAPDLRQPASLATQGFPYSGYWPTAADSGTRDPAINVSTGLTDAITVTGIAGGAP
jgi:hypothetical protein